MILFIPGQKFLKTLDESLYYDLRDGFIEAVALSLRLLSSNVFQTIKI